MLAERYPYLAAARGTVEFDSPPETPISVLDIRATPAGATTTIPSINVSAIAAAPTLTQISPPNGNVGDQLQLTGQNIPSGQVTVLFSGQNGTTIPAVAK